MSGVARQGQEGSCEEPSCALYKRLSYGDGGRVFEGDDIPGGGRGWILFQFENAGMVGIVELYAESARASRGMEREQKVGWIGALRYGERP